MASRSIPFADDGRRAEDVRAAQLPGSEARSQLLHPFSYEQRLLQQHCSLPGEKDLRQGPHWGQRRLQPSSTAPRRYVVLLLPYNIRQYATGRRRPLLPVPPASTARRGEARRDHVPLGELVTGSSSWRLPFPATIENVPDVQSDRGPEKLPRRGEGRRGYRERGTRS